MVTKHPAKGVHAPPFCPHPCIQTISDLLSSYKLSLPEQLFSRAGPTTEIRNNNNNNKQQLKITGKE